LTVNITFLDITCCFWSCIISHWSCTPKVIIRKT